MTVLNEIRKTIAALLVGLLGWATVIVDSGSGSITSGEWIMLGTVVLTTLGVYGIADQVPDVPVVEPPAPAPTKATRTRKKAPPVEETTYFDDKGA